MTWGKGWEDDPRFTYARDADPFEADYVPPDDAVDIDYYLDLQKTLDGDGQPVAPIDQFEFADREANAPTGLAPPELEAEFIDAEGKTFRLSDLAGRPFVLVFTRGYPGYVCPLCTTYTAQICAAYEDVRATGAEVLLVFPGDETKVEDFVAACRAILAEEGRTALPYPVLLDPDLTAVRRFDILADLSKPSTYVVDGSGTIRYAYVGSAPHERPSVERILAELRKIAPEG